MSECQPSSAVRCASSGGWSIWSRCIQAYAETSFEADTDSLGVYSRITPAELRTRLVSSIVHSPA